MKVLALLLVFPALGLGVVDKFIGCLMGIQTSLSSLTFSSTDPADYYGNECANKDMVWSMWAAAKVYCTPQEIEAGEKLLAGDCQTYGSVTLTPYAKVLPHLTDEYIKSLPIAQYSDINGATIFNTSVLISRPYFKDGRDTYVYFDIELALHQRYGWAIYGFWGGILLIGIINRLVTHFSTSHRMKINPDVEGGNSMNPKSRRSGPVGVVNSIHHWLRANVIVPAAFGSHHNRPYLWSTIPTRMESIIILALWMMVFILCCVEYKIFATNLYYTEAIQAWRYISDRTGIICYATLPWLWLFSGRNNIFLWLTGWSFATFNIFHRHVARLATLLAIVHSIGWTAIEGNYGGLALDWKEKYWYMGGMATVAMSFLVLFSSMWFRVKSYEIFLLIHIALSVLTLVGLFYHTAIFIGHPYNGYLWPPVIFWSLDRLARVGRWAYCNIHVKFSRAVTGTKATATYDKEGDFIRLEVVPGSRMLKPAPGQHYFLYQPLKWNGWECHPFTLSAYETLGSHNDAGSAEVGVQSDVPAMALTEKDIQVDATGPSSSLPSEVASVSSQHNPAIFADAVGRVKLTFFIRPFGGWTKRLRADCLKSETGVTTPTVFIEGPYGERSPMYTYENIIFVAGGTGISGALPYLQDHLQRVNSEGKLGTRTRDITLVWSAKQSAIIRNVAQHELKPVLGREDIHVHLHTTYRKEIPGSPGASDKSDSVHDKESLSTASASAGQQLALAHGRPNIRELILSIVEVVHNAGTAGGKIAILVCGPAAMADEARAAVHTALKRGHREVDYIEETFGW